VGGVILHEITLCCKQRSPRFPTTRNCACPGNGLTRCLQPSRRAVGAFATVAACCLHAHSNQIWPGTSIDSMPPYQFSYSAGLKYPVCPAPAFVHYGTWPWPGYGNCVTVRIKTRRRPARYTYTGNPMALALRVRRGKMAAMRGALRVVLISCLGGGTHALDNGVGLVPAAGERPQRTASCHSRRRRRRPASQCRAYAMCAGRACCSCRRRVAAIAAADAATSCRCRRPPFTERAMTRSYRLLVAGWSSWNVFGGGVTAEAVMGMADVMVEKGLDKLGYVCAFHAPPST
jgi:hypothetical protein